MDGVDVELIVGRAGWMRERVRRKKQIGAQGGVYMGSSWRRGNEECIDANGYAFAVVGVRERSGVVVSWVCLERCGLTA